MNRDLLLNEILRRYNPLLKRIIGDYFTDSDDASDVYQNLSIFLLNRLRNENDDHLSRWDTPAWLRVVTKHFCLDVIRENKAKKRINTVNYDSDDAFYAAIHSSSRVQHNEMNPFGSRLHVNIVEAMSKLNERDRRIILLRFFEGKSIQEVNDEMNLTNGSVYIERIAKKLLKIIGELGEHDGFEIIDE
jgi:RNA polymerase sigma factor (sigma-70 family)